MAYLRAMLVLLASVAMATADIGCTLQEIHLGVGTVRATSTDDYYQHGDIFYRQCSAQPRQPYIGYYPHPSDTKPKLQINLPETTAIHALVFQATLATCPPAGHDYSSEAYLETFDLQYVIPGDNTGSLVSYDQNLPALDGTSEKRLSFSEPLVTSILSLTPKTFNMYPCFRFKIIGCPAAALCDQGYCQNGGKCAGKNFCSCPIGFAGSRCDLTEKDIVSQDYAFQSIENNQLKTPSGTFDVFGDVTLVQDKRRHGHSHGHSCHFHHGHGHGHHHSYCQLHQHHSSHSSHNSHGSHGNQHSHCMQGLSNHHSGFTTSLNVHFGHNHNGHHYLFSNGGNLHGHNGCSLSYNTHTQHLHFQVQTHQHHWSVSLNHNLHQHGNTHNIACSWHPHTGAHVVVNNQVKASCGHPKPNPPQTNNQSNNVTLPLRLGNGFTITKNVSVNVNVNVNLNVSVSATMNMSIQGLNMFPSPLQQLNKLGISGPYTALPPTQQPTPPASTTLPMVSATSTHTPSTASKSNLPLFTKAPTTVPNLPLFTKAPTTTSTTTTTVDPRPACYSYQNKPTINASSNQTRCNMGDVCTLYQDKNGYTAKCLSKSSCEAGKRIATGTCWECCDSYLCNDHCSASTSLVCADKGQCAVLIATGYDVCKDPVQAVDICRKTCHKC